MYGPPLSSSEDEDYDGFSFSADYDEVNIFFN